MRSYLFALGRASPSPSPPPSLRPPPPTVTITLPPARRRPPSPVREAPAVAHERAAGGAQVAVEPRVPEAAAVRLDVDHLAAGRGGLGDGLDLAVGWWVVCCLVVFVVWWCMVFGGVWCLVVYGVWWCLLFGGLLFGGDVWRWRRILCGTPPPASSSSSSPSAAAARSCHCGPGGRRRVVAPALAGGCGPFNPIVPAPGRCSMHQLQQQMPHKTLPPPRQQRAQRALHNTPQRAALRCTACCISLHSAALSSSSLPSILIPSGTGCRCARRSCKRGCPARSARRPRTPRSCSCCA